MGEVCLVRVLDEGVLLRVESWKRGEGMRKEEGDGRGRRGEERRGLWGLEIDVELGLERGCGVGGMRFWDDELAELGEWILRYCDRESRSNRLL